MAELYPSVTDPAPTATGLAALAVPLLLAACCAVTGCFLAGCGTPAAPQPPTLSLPEPVKDLAASRTANQVTLTWTMPRRTTDHELLKAPTPVVIWRADSLTAAPQRVGTIAFPPGAEAHFADTLPPTLDAGSLRPLLYTVELLGKHGRSAGPSTPAWAAAGAAPPALGTLATRVRADGVAITWPGQPNTFVLLHRHLEAASRPATKSSRKGGASLTADTDEPVDVDLRVDAGPDWREHASPAAPGSRISSTLPGTIDTSARFDRNYSYTAQQGYELTIPDPTPMRQPAVQPDQASAAATSPTTAAATTTATSHDLQILGPLSPPVLVAVVDTFPPAVPQALVAVWTTANASIDLAWQADDDADLAGYIVYRRDLTEAASPSGNVSDWRRVSPALPVFEPAFSDKTVQPGHSYQYAVSAVDQLGNESARSATASESVPASSSSQ